MQIIYNDVYEYVIYSSSDINLTFVIVDSILFFIKHSILHLTKIFFKNTSNNFLRFCYSDLSKIEIKTFLLSQRNNIILKNNFPSNISKIKNRSCYSFFNQGDNLKNSSKFTANCEID